MHDFGKKLLQVDLKLELEEGVYIFRPSAQIGQLIFHILAYTLEASQQLKDRLALSIKVSESKQARAIELIIDSSVTLEPYTDVSQIELNSIFSEDYSFGICERIIELNQAYLKVESTSQYGGTRLRVVFPEAN